MKFCSNCGTSDIEFKTPPGDNRARHVCPECDTIFYDNPRIVAGTIPVWEDRVLMCRRAIEPRRGFWTLPAGFMENAESSFDAAARETLEEANARVDSLELYSVFNLPHVNQVYMMFRARLLDLDFSAGEESLEVALLSESEVPWPELAFPTIQHTLEHFFRDRKAGRYPVRTGDILRVDGATLYRQR
jgi:ADP-ribose pyrophosphatase YjhB (NUDIX family)